ncbi:MAG TPA: UDP-N-acetylglucosamine 2-epimerase (non-hydrolyzing), partial [Capsulimonadaceae bacterium]|nr:UDP-N-acetylglucosamine 2-epimerase (non-hydrolyzing) [Capsulimonadaceae bacterium]
MKFKVFTVFGTRPDAIKMAPVVKELERRFERFDHKVVVTGQHREMLDQVLSLFEIAPQYDLNIMQAGQTLAGITTRALEGLEKVFAAEAPSAVLAQGDTTTTFVAALAAFYHKAVFGHVEAGLRTGNRYDPFPEEMNRLLTTRLATLHFPPTRDSEANLLAEGVRKELITVTGNTVIDALLSTAAKSYTPTDPQLAEALAKEGRMVLVTAHRRENWGEPMERICRAVAEIVDRFPDTHIVFPMHRNPVVRATVTSVLGGKERVALIDPPDYAPFV